MTAPAALVVGREAALRRTHAYARDVARTRGLDAANAPWADHRAPARGGPSATLHIDDVSGVPFLDDIVGVQHYQLRARVRAGDGDLYAAASDEVAGYEAYCRDRLGLGAPSFVAADPVGPPIAVAEACRQGRAFDVIRGAAERFGGLVVHPYMGIEPAWELARDVAARANVPVRVIGPPPAVTELANDKARVTAIARELVSDLVGWDVAIPTRVATTPESIAAALAAFARDHPWVALKMTRCASAMGNRVVASATVRAMARPALRDLVDTFLADKRWSPGETVLAVAWEDADASPSTQLWIPPLGDGEPRVDGVYEQLLAGPERVFWGSVPSRLGADVDARLSRASLRVAKVYQHLGYVGRCSFDFITLGDRACFVECNGRWGGTSTPMHLLDRLFPDGRPPYRARDFVAEELKGIAFEDLLRRLGDRVWRADNPGGRYVLYNVGCLAPYGKLDVIALGADDAEAEHALEVAFPEALGAP